MPSCEKYATIGFVQGKWKGITCGEGLLCLAAGPFPDVNQTRHARVCCFYPPWTSRKTGSYPLGWAPGARMDVLVCAPRAGSCRLSI